MRIAILGLPLVGCHRQPASGRPSSTGSTERQMVVPENAVLTAQLDALRQRADIPGLAVAVLHDTTLVYAHAFGFADLATQRATTTETPFNIASVSKPISAVVALRLVQDGLLDLDTPMQHFRDFAEFCRDARRQGRIFFRDYACGGDSLTLRHVLSMTANGAPGTRFWYHPPSYSWASRPIMEVTGRAFSTLVDSLIFRVADMQQSARINRALPLRPDLAAMLALPYHRESAGKQVQSEPPPPQGDGAAGGVISTVLDLARFDIALETGRLITPSLRDDLFRGTTTADGRMLPYGLGWFLGTVDGRRVAWHTGLWDGRYSALYLKVLGTDAHARYTFVLLANSDGLQWTTELDEAAIERSPFAMLMLRTFAR